MARVRGGNTGYAVALVIFGCGFVIALLVAIIFYTKIEAAKAAEVAAQEELAKYVASNETGAAQEYIADGKTAYAGMKAEIDRLNDALDGPLGANKKIADLNASVSKMQSGFDDINKIKNDLDAALKREREQFASIMNQRQDQVNALITEKDNLVAQISDLQQKVNDSIQDADAAARDRIAELSEQVSELEGEILALNETIEQRDDKIDELYARLPQLPVPNTTFPDGRVASVFGSGRNLFINLGRKDGLVLGMTFEIFDPDPVIRLNAQGEPRGKATVEVYALDTQSATCRVVRMDKGEQIDPGDPIVNITYDPDMDISIYAFGFFDIERDGGESDIDRIRTLIVENGGEVPELKKDENGIPILTPDLNYVVLGAEPVLPEKPGADEFDPEVIDAYNAKRAEVEAYFSIVDEAKLLRIPVLNQDRFLELVGYYVR